MIDKIMNVLKKYGISEKEKEEQILKELEEIGISGIDNKNINVPDDAREIVKTLAEQNKALMGQIEILRKALSEEKELREAAIRAEKERLEKEKQDKINQTLNQLLAEKKIVEADKQRWQKLLETDYDNTIEIIKQLKPVVESEQEHKESKEVPPTQQKVTRDMLVKAISEKMQEYKNN